MKSWVKFGLIWGIFMFLMLNVIFPLFDGSEITWQRAAINIPVWIIGGLIFGYLSRKKEPKNQL